MRRLSRPWSRKSIPEGEAFGPADCLLSETSGDLPKDIDHALLVLGSVRGEARRLALHPYPARTGSKKPERIGFPSRPQKAAEPRTQDEAFAFQTLWRMNEVLSRIQELEEALDEPTNLWQRLRDAWDRAADEATPRMAEIVRQSREVQPSMRALEKRIRRVLRRSREPTPLDRVQEMDRASMLWLVRQPGRTIAERAGTRQRILATVRRENFDTLENRVLHAYAVLAAQVAREWLREHPRARGSQRFSDVEAYHKLCVAFDRTLTDLGVRIAEPGVTPNYVLMQDQDYRNVRDAWIRLLKREEKIDDLWAWQAQTWSDFAVLAVILSIEGLEEAELVAQSPILFQDEAVLGQWFDQDRPLAVFWLRKTGLIVEVQSRPEKPSELQTLTRAHVFLRITDLNGEKFPRRVAVWTPHAMQRLDLDNSLVEASALLGEIQYVNAPEILKNGLIITPAHGLPEAKTYMFSERGRDLRIDAVALDASGQTLAAGMRAISAFVRGELFCEQP